MAGITYTIDFAAAIARLEEGTVKGSQAVQKMASEMEAASSFAKQALASIGIALSGAAFTAAVKSAADAADAAAKMGDRFGIATEQVIAMQHAASLAGVSNEALTTALRGLAKSGVEAAQGNEQAREAFQRLGLQASEFIKLPMDKQLSTVIDKLGGMENAAVRNATAQALMGRQAGEVMGLVAEGSAAFEKAREDTEAWGLALNRVDAAKIELANDALKRASDATKGVFTQISLALSPAVIALANHFADAKAKARGYRNEISQGTDIAVEAIGYAMNFVQGLRLAWVGAKLAVAEAFNAMVQGAAIIADTTGGIGKALALLPGPLGIAAKAIRSFGSEGESNLKLFAESTAQTVDDIKAELDRLAEEGLPHDQIVEKIKQVSAAIDAEAKKLADNRAKFMKQGDDLVVAAFSHYTATLAQELGALIDHNKDELQLAQEQYARRQALLDEAAQKRLISDDFWQGQSMLLFAKSEADKTRILDEALKKRYGISQVYRELDLRSSSYFFGALGAMMVSHNRAAFEIGKAAAISQAIIDTYRAAQGAWAALSGIPIVGPALGAAAYAAAIVVGLARVQQIRSTSFGGGGGGGGATATFDANPTTGVPTAPILPQPSQAGPGASSSQAPVTINVNVTTNGNVVGDAGIKQLVNDNIVPALKDLIDNHDVVIIGQNSRQASNLAAV